MFDTVREIYYIYAIIGTGPRTRLTATDMLTFIRIIFFFAVVISFFSFSYPLRNPSPPQPVVSKDIGDEFYRDGAYKDALKIYRLFAAGDSAWLDDEVFRMKAGIAAYHAGECSLALRYLDSDVVADPELAPYCHYFRGRAFFRMNRHDEAKAALERISGDLALAVVRDAMELRIETLRALSRFREAHGLLEKLIAGVRTPAMRAGYYLSMAKNYYALGERDNAYRTIRKLVESHPRTNAALEGMRLYLRDKRNRKERLTFPILDWAVDLLIQHRQGREAVRVLDENPVSNPTIAEQIKIRHHRGRALLYAGNYAEARKIFLGLNAPDIPERYRYPALLSLARISLSTGDEAKAQYYYKEHLRQLPSGSMAGEIRWKLGWMAEGRKDYAGALEHYAALEKGNSSFKERGMMRAGFCHYARREFGKAAETFDRLSRTGREESMREGGLYWKAVCLEKSGEHARAAAGFREVIKRYPLHYYAFRARERLNEGAAQAFPQTLVMDSLFAGRVSLPADSLLLRTIEIGEITGRRYGKDALEHFRRTGQGRRHNLETYWNAYHRIGAFNEALKMGIYLRQEAKAGGGADSDPELLWRVYPPFYRTLVERHAKEQAVPPGIVYALMRRESAFEADVISSAGAIGLMQMLPSTGRATGKDLGIDDITGEHLKQPVWNIRLGVKHLRDLIDSFNGALPAAIASYNAGEGAVRRWMSIFGVEDIEYFIEAIEYTETRNYVRRVLGDYWIYQGLYQW